LKLSPQTIYFKLFDAQGNLVQEGPFPLGGTHRALFVSEFVTIPARFTGMLILESEAAFAPVGVRLGGDVLSTIPVVSLAP
jgi:hypothetical protein